MHLEVDCCVPVSTVAVPCRIGKTVNRCYTTKTEEFADEAMESTKLSYAAILSHDKEDDTPQRSDVNVNDRVHRPRPEPVNAERVEARTRRRETEDRDLSLIHI